MPTTPRGVFYPGPNEANDVAGHIGAIAQYVDANPGIATFTTAQRDALAGAVKWNGRVIYNTTTRTLNVWDSLRQLWTDFGGQTTQTFTASGTWVRPDGVRSIKVEAIGGGGNGASAPTGAGIYVGGGGGGGYASRTIVANDLPDNVAVTVGGPGGSTTFGSLVTASPGGAGAGAGAGAESSARGGAGGGVSGGRGATAANLAGIGTFGGGGGGVNLTSNGISAASAGGSELGGGGGAAVGGGPGPSANAGSGGAAATSSSANGSPGSAPGGGGGAGWPGAGQGNAAGTTGGLGARGELRITHYF